MAGGFGLAGIPTLSFLWVLQEPWFYSSRLQHCVVVKEPRHRNTKRPGLCISFSISQAAFHPLP